MRIVKRRRRRRRSYQMRALSLRRRRVSGASLWTRLSADRIAALGVLMCVLAFLAYSGFAWDFYDYPVTVRGGRLVSEQLVRQECGLEGYHIFFVDSSRCRQTLMELLEVKDATVKVNFPPRVVVGLSERTPVMELVAGGRSFWVDEEGIILPKRESLPVDFQLEVEGDVPVELGNRLYPLTLRGALAVARAGWGRRARFAPDEGFIVMADEGYPVYLGVDPSLMRARREAYLRMREFFASRGIRPAYLDLRWPLAPVYAPAT